MDGTSRRCFISPTPKVGYPPKSMGVLRLGWLEIDRLDRNSRVPVQIPLYGYNLVPGSLALFRQWPNF